MGTTVGNLISRLFWSTMFSFVVGCCALSAYIYNLYSTARPAFSISGTSRPEGPMEKERVFNALLKLSAIAEILGSKKLHILATASAGRMIGDSRKAEAVVAARFYLNSALVIAKDFMDKTKEADPLLETYQAYAWFLSDIGEKAEALSLVETALKIGKQEAPLSYQIKNLERSAKAIAQRD